MIEPMTIEQYLDNLKELEGVDREEYLKCALANQIEERDRALINFRLSEQLSEERRVEIVKTRAARDAIQTEIYEARARYDLLQERLRSVRDNISKAENILTDALHMGELEKDMAKTHAQRNNFRAVIRVMLHQLSDTLHDVRRATLQNPEPQPFDDLPF